MDNKFFEELLKNKPAKITAESDDKGSTHIKFDGRGIELLALAIGISEQVLKGCPLSVDDYCEILKMGGIKHQDKSKEQKDVENVIINKMLRDIFK